MHAVLSHFAWAQQSAEIGHKRSCNTKSAQTHKKDVGHIFLSLAFDKDIDEKKHTFIFVFKISRLLYNY